MRACFLIFAGSMLVAAPAPGATEGQVSEKVIQAWKDAGAEVRWVATSGLWDNKPTPGCRVGFWFHGWVQGRLESSRRWKRAFHLMVSFAWPRDESAGIAMNITDEGVKELVKFEIFNPLIFLVRTSRTPARRKSPNSKSLEGLDLSCTKVTAAGLAELTTLQSIKRLALCQMDVTEGMFKEVAAFKSLNRLFLSNNKSEVTSAGMKHIAKLEKLEKLSFFNVNVSDAGAKELSPLKNLKDLDFLNTNVTKAGGKELQKLLPKCDISVRTIDLTLPPPAFPPLPIEKE